MSALIRICPRTGVIHQVKTFTYSILPLAADHPDMIATVEDGQVKSDGKDWVKIR